MKAAIFAVVSPLQYINALEAVAAFGLKPSQCYLALGESKKLPATAQQVRSLLEPERWRSVETVTGVPVSRGRNAIHTELRFLRGARKYADSANRLLRQAREECDGIQYVFLGDYRPANFRHFLGTVPEAEHWLLDDGSVTHQVVRFRKDQNSPHLFAKPFAQADARTFALSKISGLRFAEPRSVGYFTCYDLTPPAEDHVRTHDYAYFRERYPSMEPNDEIWFLGANHVENKFTTPDRYHALLKRALAFYAGERVIYLPHRGETEAKLLEVSEMGFEVRNFDLPVEIAIGQAGKFPKVLAGIASSAIDNLSVILRERLNVHLFCVAEGYAPTDRWRHLKDVIGYHERNVFGLTSFVYEDDYGSRTGPVMDYRYSTRDSGQVESRCAGYICGPDGFLHGYLKARLTLHQGEAVRVSFQSLPMSRDFKVGDRIGLIGPEDQLPVQACVEDVLLSGDIIVSGPSLNSISLGGQWTVELIKSRLEHYASKPGLAGLLVEPGHDNLLPHSAEFERAPFGYHGICSFSEGSMSSSGVVSSPDGRDVAALLKLDRSSGVHSMFQVVSDGSCGGSVCFSAFFRYGGCEKLKLVIEHPESKKKAIAEYNVNGGGGPVLLEEPYAETGAQAEQKDYRDSWKRCSLSAILPEGDIRIELQFAIHEEFEFFGDGCSGAYVWGPQFERASAPSSYFPTDLKASVRAADSVDFEIDTDEATLFLELALPYTRAPIVLLSVGDEFIAEIDGAGGRLLVRGGRTEYVGDIDAISPDEPFVLGIRRRGNIIDFFVNSGNALCNIALPGPAANVRVAGGPFHLRRSYLHRRAWSGEALPDLCSVRGLSAL